MQDRSTESDYHWIRRSIESLVFPTASKTYLSSVTSVQRVVFFADILLRGEKIKDWVQSMIFCSDPKLYWKSLQSGVQLNPLIAKKSTNQFSLILCMQPFMRIMQLSLHDTEPYLRQSLSKVAYPNEVILRFECDMPHAWLCKHQFIVSHWS